MDRRKEWCPWLCVDVSDEEDRRKERIEIVKRMDRKKRKVAVAVG